MDARKRSLKLLLLLEVVAQLLEGVPLLLHDLVDRDPDEYS